MKSKLIFASSIIINLVLLSALFVTIRNNLTPRESLADFFQAIFRKQHVYDFPLNGLPKILVIGDSISIGYTPVIAQLMTGLASVQHAPGNCMDTRNGVLNIGYWLGSTKWDVIIFNFGIHDLSYKTKNLETPSPDLLNGYRQCSPLQYERNLSNLVERLKLTNAKLLFCTTTPIPDGIFNIISGDELLYNQIAVRIMQSNKINIVDLHTFCLPRLNQIQIERNVHFTDFGYLRIGEHITESVQKIYTFENSHRS